MASVQLALQQVSMVFGQRILFQNLNLAVPAGERLVLIGPSGQGKTVLLKLLAGLIKPTSGQILYAGQDISAVAPQELDHLRLQVGMLFQKNALFDSLTASENVAFPLREKSALSEAEIKDKVGYFLEEVGLSHAANLYPDEISGGMQKRLGIARALALGPKVVFYDDPTAGLDPITSRRIVELILRLQNQENSTLVAVTNDMARAYQLGTRLAVVVDGELIVTGDRQETLRHPDPRVYQFVRGQLTGPLTESA